jgi:threonine/homoserine/homoserine lactone efflux protein
MRILFEVIGCLGFVWILFLGLRSWASAQERLAADRRELEEFRRNAKPETSTKETSQHGT